MGACFGWLVDASIRTCLLSFRFSSLVCWATHQQVVKELVFSHQDLLCGNILFNPEWSSLQWIVHPPLYHISPSSVVGIIGSHSFPLSPLHMTRAGRPAASNSSTLNTAASIIAGST